MYIPSKSSTENQIDRVAHMVLSGKSSEELSKANLIEECLTPMKHDRSLRIEMKVKISNELSTRKKASRNSIFNLLGYTIMSIRIISEDIVSVAKKTDFENQRAVREKIFKEYKRSGGDYGFSRKTNAYQMTYLSLPSKNNLYGLDLAEKIVSNIISSSVFAKYLEWNICLKPDKDECTNANIARLDA